MVSTTTHVTQREYFESRLENVANQIKAMRESSESQSLALREYFDAKFDNLDKANRVLADTMREKFNTVNEFRATLSDQAAAFPTRNELEPRFAKLMDEVDGLRQLRVALSSLERLAAEVDNLKQIRIILSDFERVVAKVDSLELSRAELKGKASQSSVNIATLFSLLAAILGVIGLAVAILK